MNPKLTELLAELDKEIIDYGAVTLTQREYDLLRSALREREGMVLVPREPTPKMIEAMASAWQTAVENDAPDECVAEYRAMLAAVEGE